VRTRGLRHTFERHQERLVADRLRLTAGLYLWFVGLAIVTEWLLHPGRRAIIALTFTAHVLASAPLLAAGRARAGGVDARVLAAAVGSAWSLILSSYSLVVVANPERAASAQICLLYGLFFMLPWRWREQLAVSLVALAGILAGGVVGGVTEAFVYGIIVVSAGGATSVGGVLFLERYRFADFIQNAKLLRVSRARRAEAEISAALLRISETLGRRVNEVDLLACLARVAVETVGCDWGSTFVKDEGRGTYRLGAVFGEPPGVREEMEALEFTSDNLPLIHVLEPGRLVEIADARTQALVPPALLEHWQVASEVIAPIGRNDQVVGALCLAYRERRGPFTARERRLAYGIAHSAALALANAKLIGDLRAANTLRSQFVSTMSHELRTPLNVILGFAEMAQEPGLDATERCVLLQRVEAAGRDLLRLIEDTLAMGRIEAGREVIDLKAVELRPVWEALGHECGGLASGSDVTLDWEPMPIDATVITDARKLMLIVRNLVHNALKFTERGWVRAALAVEPDALVLTVADSGIGIHPADHETIFEMFRQADGSDTRRYGGTGLGLHIVRRYAELLGGTIGLESARGQGACFTVRLPRQPGPYDADHRPARAHGERARRNVQPPLSGGTS
jgi:signal transduction histidine kinase